MHLLVALILSLFTLSASDTPDACKMLSVVLYQPNNVLKERVTDVTELSSYIKALNAATSLYMATLPKGKPAIVDVVVAYQPTGKSNIWLVTDGNLADLKDLAAKLKMVPAPHARGGAVAFSIHASAWGATDGKPFAGPPIPAEWQAALKGSSQPAVLPDDVLPKVWKD